MHRMIGKVYKLKKVCDIVRHSEDIKIFFALLGSNGQYSTFFYKKDNILDLIF